MAFHRIIIKTEVYFGLNTAKKHIKLDHKCACKCSQNDVYRQFWPLERLQLAFSVLVLY